MNYARLNQINQSIKSIKYIDKIQNKGLQSQCTTNITMSVIVCSLLYIVRRL
jgi:hypothetical protein